MTALGAVTAILAALVGAEVVVHVAMFRLLWDLRRDAVSQAECEERRMRLRVARPRS